MTKTSIRTAKDPKPAKRRLNRYQLTMRIAVIFALLFFILLSFSLELLFSK